MAVITYIVLMSPPHRDCELNEDLIWSGQGIYTAMAVGHRVTKSHQVMLLLLLQLWPPRVNQRGGSHYNLHQITSQID